MIQARPKDTIKFRCPSGTAEYLVFNLSMLSSEFEDVQVFIQIETDGQHVIASYLDADSENIVNATTHDPEKILYRVQELALAGNGVFYAPDGEDGWIEFANPISRTLFVPLLIYPGSGRAAAVGPSRQWVMRREDAIKSIRLELQSLGDEPKETIDLAMTLLQTHDRVRCGRVICQIITAPQTFSWQGAEIL